MVTADYQSVATSEVFLGGQFSDASSSHPLYHTGVRAIILLVNKPDTTIRFATLSDKLAWDRVVKHPLQAWAWGEFRRQMNLEVVRLAVIKQGKLVDGWQLTFHQLPYLPWTAGYFPKGPLPSAGMIQQLIKLGRQERAIFIQLEPNTPANFKFQISNFKLLRPSHHPLFTKYTFILDLTLSENKLLSAMHSKTRYNIRLAERHGVKVAEDNSDEAFKQYLRLTAETTGRQGFYAHNEMYHRQMWRTMRQAGIAHLFTANYQDKTLACWIILVWKDTIYYPYGASSRYHREVMAPTLMLWEIAKWGKQKGFKYFDLWGALGRQPDERDPWYGFHRFKLGFGPKLVELVGSYDLVINPFLYRLYTIADSLRWTLLRLKFK